ncbi:UNVERIFIED_CONTAM: Retrovirus-related Pol polyprotein from transposon RE1 [Sesamum angustifolium]|uniref:Retrovirus-related Pol polyprotein from transposon RE1 n=1 Tax=Sesamum angustifolium TaxID=2727405 RepID=A0AAW2MQX6_9LAMI
MVNNNVLISRDVVFHENIFPYHYSKPTEPDPIPIPNPIPDTIIPAPSDTAPISHIDQPISTNNVPIPAEHTIQPLKGPHRHVKSPAWWNDFYCNNASDPLHTSCSFSSSHNDFLAILSTVQEPNNYMQAKGQEEWENAMQQKIAALEKNATWEVVDLPKDKKAIGSKWVYKIKLNSDGTIERYKARLVVKGYNQVEGVDYIDRFSPVAKAVTVLLLLVVASSYAWPIHQVDINNAFLHGFLDEDIYMSAPDGYSVPEGTSESQIVAVKQFLDSEFTIKDLGHAKYFLGLEIARPIDGTSVTQYKYIRDIIQDAGLTSCKPTHTPLSLGLKLSSQNSPPLLDLEPYRRLVGRLLYLGFTRPDISFGAQQLSQFVHRPCQTHLDAALHLVRYLKGNPDQGLFFPCSNPLTLTAYCDADWVGCVDSRRSLTRYCIFLGNAPISWKTKKQPTVACSTAEAEYRSLGATVCELQWLSYLLQDFKIDLPTPIPLYCDNQVAV